MTKHFARLCFMDIKDLTIEQRKIMAAKAGTSEQYLYQIGKGIRTPSRKLAARLVEASGGLLLYEELLRKPEQIA